MFHRKQRRFRRRPNGRTHSTHGNGGMQSRLRPGSFSNDQKRNNFRSTMSAEKLLEKYNSLAKEALTSGDKTLSENYLQHADHFMRIIEDKNKSRNKDKINVVDQPAEGNKNLPNSNEINQDSKFKDKG